MKKSGKTAKTLNIFGHKTILLSWFISYVVVLILPVLSGFAINVYIKDSLKNELRNSNKLKLAILKGKVDEFFFESERLANELFYNSDAAKLAEAREINPQLRYSAMEIGDSLEKNMISDMRDMTGYVYFPKNDMVLSHGMLNSSRVFYNTYYANSGFGYDDWIKNLTGGQQTYTINSGYDFDYGSEVVIENIRPVQMIGRGAEETSVLVTAINSGALFDGAIDDENNEAVIIFDKNESILISGGIKYGDEFIKRLGAIDNNDFLCVKDGSRSFIISGINSDWNGMQYVYAVDAGVFNHRVAVVWWIIGLSTAFSILIGAATIIYVIKRNYRPIKAITDTIRLNENTDGDGEENEYAFIKRGIESIISQKRTADMELKTNNETLGKVYLLMAVMARNNVNIRSRLESAGIVFEKKYFYVALVNIDNFDALSGGLFENSRDMVIAKYSVRNAIEKSVKRCGTCSDCESNNMMIYVINSDDGDTERIKQSISEASGAIYESLGLRLRISVSGAGEDIDELNRLYYDAVYAAESAMTDDIDEIADYSEIEALENADETDYSSSKWSELRGMVRLNDIESAESMIDYIIEKDFSDPQVSATVKACLGNMLISMLMQQASEMGAMNRELIYKGMDCMRAMTDAFDADGLRRGLKELCAGICGSAQIESAEGIKFSNEVIKFVEDNYSDPDLNVTSIGREFGKTSAYVSKKFLMQTGTKLLDYINMYRVNKAKELLINSPNERIEKVGELVGFAVNRTFLRTFKKYVGISPGMFRDYSK